MMRRRVLFLSLVAGSVFADSALGQEVDHTLFEALFGEPVTTSATGKPERLSETPVNMQIITAEDIRRSGADNIPDILRFVAGLDVRRYGFTDADVGVRGYDIANSPRVLVLVNGRQIYVDYHSYTAWQTLPVQLGEVRQIEVIKGPNSALFGFNAVGGVINIITFDPLFDSVDEATVRAGTQHYASGSAIATGHLGDQAGLRLSAGGLRATESSSAQMPPSYNPFNPNNLSHSFNADGRWKPNASSDLRAEVSQVDARQFEMGVGGYPGTTHYSVNSQKLGMGTATAIGNLDLTAYRNWIDWTYYIGGNWTAFNEQQTTLYVVQASDVFKAGNNHIFRLGLEYRNDDNRGSYFAGERMGFDLFAGSAMWNWQVRPDVSLTNSVRVDHFTAHYRGPIPDNIPYTVSDYNSTRITRPSFNSAVVYRPTALDSVRLTVARGVQPPDNYALFPEPVAPAGSDFVPGTGIFEGMPRLKPSIVTNYEADYTRSLPPIDAAAEIAVYDQRTRNVLADPGDAGAADAFGYVYSGNIGRSEATGGELTLKGSLAGGWRWNVGYALTVITDHLSVNHVVPPDSAIDYQHGAPVHTVIGGFGRSWGRFDADLSARWQSRFDDIAIGIDGATLARTPVDDYAILMGHVGYRISDAASLGLTGLKATATHTTAGLPMESRLFATATCRF